MTAAVSATITVTTMNQPGVFLYCATVGMLLGACVDNPAPDTAGELDSYRIKVGERERSYLLYTPEMKQGSSGKRPLILVFHGGGGTAKGIAREVGRSLHAIADREDVFVAYPDASE